MGLFRRDISTAAIVRLYRSGRTIREIAASFDCGPNLVYGRLIASGEPLRARGGRRTAAPLGEVQRRYLGGERVPDIALSIGITQAAVYNRLRRNGTPMKRPGRQVNSNGVMH